MFICFDADAATNPSVAKAMGRLGRWLRSKGAEPKYVVVPGRPEDKTGADDFLAADGTLKDLIEAATTQPPEVAAAKSTDAEVAGELAGELDGQYHWTSGLGWMRWDGRSGPGHQIPMSRARPPVGDAAVPRGVRPREGIPVGVICRPDQGVARLPRSVTHRGDRSLARASCWSTPPTSTPTPIC